MLSLFSFWPYHFNFACYSSDLGYKIDAKGLHTTPQKVKAIQQAPHPKNVQQLRSFLGLVHYYGRFIPNLATITEPLNKLATYFIRIHNGNGDKIATKLLFNLNLCYLHHLCWFIMAQTVPLDLHVMLLLMELAPSFHISCQMNQKSQ